MGVYDPPAQARGAAGGVVICAPFGHEYTRSYRALRNLATALAGAGLHVLRFDYSGCGDSAGSGRDATVEQWHADVAIAVDELKDMAALPRVAIIGVRFGAALAAVAASRRGDIDTLVLWDPVITGSRHLQELRDLQQRWLVGRPRPQLPEDWPVNGEIIGFPMPPPLEAGFDRTDLRSIREWPAKRLVAVTSGPEDARELEAHLEALRRPCTFEHVDADCEWRRPRAVHLALLATDVVKRISSVFSAGRTV